MHLYIHLSIQKYIHMSSLMSTYSLYTHILHTRAAANEARRGSKPLGSRCAAGAAVSAGLVLMPQRLRVGHTTTPIDWWPAAEEDGRPMTAVHRLSPKASTAIHIYRHMSIHMSVHTFCMMNTSASMPILRTVPISVSESNRCAVGSPTPLF